LILGDIQEQIKVLQEKGLKEVKQGGDPTRKPFFRKTEKELMNEVKAEQQKFLQLMRNTSTEIRKTVASKK
jgi:hypothetical protein